MGLKHATAQHPVDLLRTILLQSIPESMTLKALNAIYFSYNKLNMSFSNPFWAATDLSKTAQAAAKRTKLIMHVRPEKGLSNARFLKQ